jgi:hypothetical protein
MDFGSREINPIVMSAEKKINNDQYGQNNQDHQKEIGRINK